MHEQEDRGEVESHLPTSEAPELVLRLQLPLQLEPAMPELEEDVVGEDEQGDDKERGRLQPDLEYSGHEEAGPDQRWSPPAQAHEPERAVSQLVEQEQPAGAQFLGGVLAGSFRRGCVHRVPPVNPIGETLASGERDNQEIRIPDGRGHLLHSAKVTSFRGL